MKKNKFTKEELKALTELIEAKNMFGKIKEVKCGMDVYINEGFTILHNKVTFESEEKKLEITTPYDSSFNYALLTNQLREYFINGTTI